MYYLCSETKEADQLRGHSEADLRLCFRICKKPVFSQRGSCMQISLCIWINWWPALLFTHIDVARLQTYVPMSTSLSLSRSRISNMSNDVLS